MSFVDGAIRRQIEWAPPHRHPPLPHNVSGSVVNVLVFVCATLEITATDHKVMSLPGRMDKCVNFILALKAGRTNGPSAEQKVPLKRTEKKAKLRWYGKQGSI